MEDKPGMHPRDGHAVGLSARDAASREQSPPISARDEVAGQREGVLRARSQAEEATPDGERLMAQLRDANEQLVLATVRADELAEQALAARAMADELAAREAEGRRRAEALAEELLVSEAALLASEGQFRTLANTVPMLVWHANPDGHVAWYNQRWYDYTGTSFHEQVGWRWQSVVAPDDLQRIVGRWSTALASGEPWEETLRLRRQDGAFRWFLARARPLRDVTGRIVRWFGTAVDIDDQKRTETHVQASNRAKDEFLAILGHELRNPLAPILTALDLMTMSDPTVFKRERAVIERQVKHLVHLVDDLLDVSRLTGGKLELQCQPIELAEVVARAVEMVSPLLEKKAHHLSVYVPSHGMMVDGDATRLAQVAGNLLINAAKYTPPRGSIIVIGEARGSSVVLRVRDTGIGISAEMLPHVFDLFAQDRQAIDSSQGGLGLGLAIVHSLVAMHGGTATAYSEGLGRGSELTVELPRSTRERGLAPPNAPVRPSAAPADARKVLVVDDNREAAELIAVSLAALGHEVRTAFDGPSALGVVGSFVPDVALLDIGLPVMDGYELASRLRTLLSPRDIRFVAITGYGDAADRRRSQEAGFAMHLVKPVDVVAIEDSVRGSAAPVPPLVAPL